jgi:exodeoxyribonuclease III
VLRVISVNVNGLRSAATKGFMAWADAAGADCMGLQEVRMQASDVQQHAFERIGALSGAFACAQKKGYAGVAMYTRREPSDVVVGMGVPEFDDEGRWIETRFDTPARKLSVISCYFPSGSAGPERQASKFRFLDVMAPHLRQLQGKREFVLIGDVNIAHHEIDLKNWKGNLKNSGFLPEERAWMTALLSPKGKTPGLVDVFRTLNPGAEQYTWWSNRGQARAKNVGWRIDYQLATPGIAATALRTSIFKDQFFSDHAPLTVDYELTL